MHNLKFPPVPRVVAAEEVACYHLEVTLSKVDIWMNPASSAVLVVPYSWYKIWTRNPAGYMAAIDRSPKVPSSVT